MLNTIYFPDCIGYKMALITGKKQDWLCNHIKGSIPAQRIGFLCILFGCFGLAKDLIPASTSSS